MELSTCCGIYSPQIKSKSDLMKYCLEFTARRNKKREFICHNIAKAKKLFDFFLENVNLPDVETQPEREMYSGLMSLFANKASAVDTA